MQHTAADNSLLTATRLVPTINDLMSKRRRHQIPRDARSFLTATLQEITTTTKSSPFINAISRLDPYYYYHPGSTLYYTALFNLYYSVSPPLH
jgi:hypothetical protein